MHSRIQNLPLKKKLLLSFMITSGAVLALTCCIFMVNDSVTQRGQMLREAVALADTVGNNSTAAIVFDDYKGARDILNSFKAHSSVDMAALYRKDGTEIVRYVRLGVSGEPVRAMSPDMQKFDQKNIQVSRPIYFEHEIIGRIYLRYSLSALTTRQWNFLMLTLLVLLFVSCFAYAIASILMKYISEPLQELAQVVRAVSLQRDYRLRVKGGGVDEIGMLSDSFNDMLAQIQERDRQLVLHHEQLEDQVAKRTCQLETANTQLRLEIDERVKAEEARRLMEDELLKSRKLESVGVLAGGIAHDFNNILTSIVGFISLTRNRTKADEKVQEFLALAEKGCFRAKSLTKQLLAFSRGGKPVRRTTSLIPVIHEAIAISMVGSNVRCNTAIDDDLHPVNIDAGQIIQVLNNILLNACQAMIDGGTLVVSARNVSVDNDVVFSLPPGEYVMICVEDFGCGIAEENLHRIFDPYFSTKLLGNGLGLATCYAIVKNHDGIITVSSESGKGTTVSICLPQAAAGGFSEAAPVVGAVAANVAASRNCKRVLVMDDEKVIRDVAAQMCAEIGCSVALACDGSEALAMYREAMEAGCPYDITIMDMTIPGGMGGVEAVEKLLEYDRNAYVVVSSGYSQEAVMVNYRFYGFSAAIAKPYTLEEFGALFKAG